MSFLLPVFQWVLNVSVMAGILTIVIILLKLLLGNKLNVKWHSWVWFLVMIRLLVPYAPETPFSVFNLWGFFSGAPNYTMSEQQINLIDNSGSAQNNGGNQPDLHNGVIGTTLPDSSGSPNSTNTHDFYLLLFCAVWLAGIAGFGFLTLVKERKFIRELKNYRPCADEKILALCASCQCRLGLSGSLVILETDNRKSPSVCGLIHPKLLMPAGIGTQLTYAELEYVILHELAHLKRKDTAVYFLISIMQIIHWFNPVLWVAFSRWRQDSEIACDAYVLSKIGANHSGDYGRVIIKLLENCSRKNAYGTVGLLGRKSQIQRRITMISLFGKGSYKWSVLSVALILVLGAVLLTNAQTMNGEDTADAALKAYESHMLDVDKDIAGSFQLSLADLKKVDEQPLYDQQEEQSDSTLLGVLSQVRRTLDYGDIKPSAYLKQDGQSGYILQKKADGTNHLYTIAYKQGWAIIKTDSAPGQKMSKVIDEIGDKVYSPLTEAQLNQYLAENKISPLAVQNIGNFTVVLDKVKREDKSDQEKNIVPENISTLIETRRLTADQDGNIIHDGGGGGNDNSDIVPVSIGVSGGSSQYGRIMYARVIINDSNLSKDADRITCYYANNITTTTPVDNQKAFIIPLPQEKAELLRQEARKLTNVIISDKNGKVLFDQNEWTKN
ncbi:M56 family metallopeptidase [Desulfosporosinus nitroreducens]|uniref:M56 family metallopeptidase n=1 Tax=Desulfosporosinus nitroreducens TaxID=2018668 RepID=A0ABT8QR87_9FIRM|nr:M56 family metallopeptidase [Desulfosporosinus nitroreducens]MDO0823869.1 M56 family metallopeptidase [Desulfosporosinus nitroreducens]